MLPKAVPNLRHALFLALLFAVVLLATSCAGPATQPSASEPGIAPTASPAAMVAEASWPVPQFSPGQHLRFERISLEQGLSQSTVFCMLQDSQGFMWFGTEDGLNKYDGYTFTVYEHDREDAGSPGSNWIQAMLEDDSGAVWLGTIDRGLDLYDRELDTFTHFQHDPQDPSSLSSDRITALHQDRDGNLWIGTGSGGLDRLVLSEAGGSDQETGRFIHYQHDPDDPNSLSSDAVSTIYEDREGALWIGTHGGGLNRLLLADATGSERGTERWWRYGHDPATPDSLSHNHVTAISEGPSGALWVGTGGGGLNRLDLSHGEAGGFTHFRHDPSDSGSLSSNDVSAIYQDREGALWIGTRDEGLNRLDPERGTFAHYRNVPGDTHSLSTNLILSIFQDREGGLWFGTIGGGINRLDVGRWRFPHYKSDPSNPDSLGDNMVRALYHDPEGPLWIGTMFGGIDRFDRETGEWRHYVHESDDLGSLSDNWTSAIYRDGAGVLWIGTGSGLDRFDPETGTFAHYQPDPDAPTGSDRNDVRVVYEDQAGEFWVGTKDGLYRFDRDKGVTSHTYRHDPSDPHSLGSGWVLNIQEDPNGTIWIGTSRGGLCKFDRGQETFVRFQNDPGDPHSLSGNRALAVLLDREGELWTGTQAGLDRYDPETQTFAHFQEKEGLPNEVVYCMLEDRQGYLWLSTNRGLSRFDPHEETFSNYDVTDGLQSNEFNGSACHVSDSGELFFGGINGFNAFFPDQIRGNPVIPPVVVTSLTQHGREVALGHAAEGVREVALRWPDNAFEFEFAAFSFAQPERNQYAYYLEGFEETWNEVGTRRSGQYTNLPGGTYTLRVKGSNNDGVWNEAGTAVQITVVPPFWVTWWFRGVVLLVLVGVVIGGYRLRVRRLEARSRELESQVDNRTKELAALNAVAAVASSSLDLQRVLSNALDKTLEVLDVEAGGIYLLQADTQALTLVAYEGMGAEFAAEIDELRVGEGFSGRVVQTGEPLVVRDLSSDPRLTRSAVTESGFHSLALAPLVSSGEVLGSLFAMTRGRREFSQQEVELLTSIGDQVGVAVENARLYEQVGQVAVVEERQRLARELHDSITQLLHSSALLAEAGQRLAGVGDLERTRNYLAQLSTISQQALKEMRLLVYELRPLALREVGLVGAVQQRLEAVERRAGVEARLVVVGDVRQGEGELELPLAVEEELYRIAEEALNNALKHAEPTSIVVTIRVQGEPPGQQVELEVVDDGRGFDPDAAREAGGLGLVSMAQRAEKLDGQLTIHSVPGEGTTVRVSVSVGDRGSS